MIRLGALGDVVRTLPSVSALRSHYAGSHLTWLVEPRSAGALAGQPWVDEVLVFPRDELTGALVRGRLPSLARRALSFVRALRERRFDLVIDFHSILKSGVLARLSGARVRVGYARPLGREGSWLLATHRARFEPGRHSRFERNAGLLDYLAVRSAPAAAPLRLDPDALRRVDAWLNGSPPPVVLHPGTSASTPYKRFPVDGYAAVARALSADGLPVAVSHGPGERALARAVVEASGGTARLALETPGLADLAALFSRARLYVGSDTGPLHVSSLVGTPVVQILGPTHPVENRPYPDTPWRQVRVPIACSPCRRGCGAAPCMRIIPPERIVDAARALLGGRHPGDRVAGSGSASGSGGGAWQTVAAASAPAG